MRFVTGIRGAYPLNDPTLPYMIDQGLILAMRDGEWVHVKDDQPVAIKVSDNWTDDFDGSKDKDYVVEVEMYRPGKEPFGMLWKCQMRRSDLRIKPELVFKDYPDTSTGEA